MGLTLQQIKRIEEAEEQRLQYKLAFIKKYGAFSEADVKLALVYGLVSVKY